SVCVARRRRWCRVDSLSQIAIPHRGFERQTIKSHLRQRRTAKSRDDIASGHGTLKPIELVGADDDNGIFAMQRHSLRTALLRLPDDLAKASFRVLKAPSPGPGAPCRGTFSCDSHE